MHDNLSRCIDAVVFSMGTLAASATTPMQGMSFMNGEWSCSISSPLGHQTEIDRNQPMGVWMHISGDVSAGMKRAATHYDGYLGWDRAHDAWVYIFVDARGGYGEFQSTASPRSRTQPWIEAYPTQGNGSFVLHHLSDTRYVIDFPLTIGATKTSVRQDCRHA